MKSLVLLLSVVLVGCGTLSIEIDPYQESLSKEDIAAIEGELQPDVNIQSSGVHASPAAFKNYQFPLLYTYSAGVGKAQDGYLVSKFSSILLLGSGKGGVYLEKGPKKYDINMLRLLPLFAIGSVTDVKTGEAVGRYNEVLPLPIIGPLFRFGHNPQGKSFSILFFHFNSKSTPSH